MPNGQLPVGYAQVNHGMFLSRLETILSPAQMEMVATAYVFAKDGHRGQFRDDQVTRYFEHLKSVSWITIDELGIIDCQVIVEALLHDIIEDRWLLTPHRLRLNFGRQTADGIMLLSKQDDHYYGRLLADGTWRELLVKGCDRLHNLRTMSIWPFDKQCRYVMKTRHHILPLVDRLVLMIPKKWRVPAQHLRALIEEHCAQIEVLK